MCVETLCYKLCIHVIRVFLQGLLNVSGKVCGDPVSYFATMLHAVCTCYGGVCLFAHVCLCIWRPEVDLEYLSSALGLWAWPTSRSFFRGFWDQNSGPRACMIGTLLTEPSPEPWNLFLLHDFFLFVCYCFLMKILTFSGDKAHRNLWGLLWRL